MSDDGFLTLAEAAAYAGYADPAALRTAISRWVRSGGIMGLQAVKRGRDWFTCVEWLADYKRRKQTHKGRP